jgi:predicted PurR-regulated permease PerM
METVPPFYERYALTLIAICLTIFFLIMGSNIFIPLVFALIFSILLYPLARLFENKLHLGRFLSALLPVLILITCVFAFVFFLTKEMVNFSQDFPELKKRMSDIFSDLQHWISKEFHVNTRQQQDYLNKSTTNILANAANSISSFFISFAGFALWIIFVFLYTFFIIYYRKLLLKFILYLFDDKHSQNVHEVVAESRTMIYSYISGLLIEMAIVGIANCTIFSIMGIKYAILLGIIAAVLNIIPYLGIYTATALIMLVTFANSTGNSALSVGIALLSVHLIDANILMPRIVGSRVKMNAFITIIAVIVGEYVWGISGMFLFIPITGIFKIISSRVEGMKPWAILIGTEEKEEAPRRKSKK